MFRRFTKPGQDQIPVSPLVRLVVEPDRRPGTFTARLESTDEVIVRNTRQPIVDGARELRRRGYPATALLTLRHDGARSDAFEPAAIGRWAAISYAEGERRGLRMVPYQERPFAVPGEAQKSCFVDRAAVFAQPAAKIAVRRGRAPATAGSP